MKTAFPVLMILALTTSAAQGAILQVETRAFHSSLQLDMKDAVHTFNGQEYATTERGRYFEKAAGGGFAFVARLDDYVSLGAGYDRARYFPHSDLTFNQQTLSVFTRWNLYQGESSQLHLLTGVSQHSLTGEGESEAGADATIKFTPVMNYDVGMGYTWSFGMWTVGLAYTYSDTFGRGNAHAVMRSQVYDELLLTETEVKTKFESFNIEEQIASLNFGIIL